MLRRIFMLLAAASLLGFGITSDGFVYGHGGGGLGVNGLNPYMYENPYGSLWNGVTPVGYARTW